MSDLKIKMIKLIVPGKPIAKKRPRFFKKGNYVGAYNPQETEEGRFLFEIKSQWKEAPVDDPIKLTTVFFLPIPKGTSKLKTNHMVNGLIKHTKKPDCDNLVKFVKDCLSQVVWRDDSQVFWLQAEKQYSLEPRTLIIVEMELSAHPAIKSPDADPSR